MKRIAAEEGGPVWRDPRAIALLMAATLIIMANATISPALAALEKMFANDPNAGFLTRLLVPAPSLSVVFFAPLAGLAADRFGRRWMMLSGLILFAIAGSAGLILPDMISIFASRLVLGVAVAMIMTAQTALIGDYFRGDHRNALTGLQISARNFGGLLFIPLAGWLALYSARLPFAIYGLALLYLPFMWLYIAEPKFHKSDAVTDLTAETEGLPSWKPLLITLACLQMMTNLIFFIMPTQLAFFFDARGYESSLMTGAALGVLTLTGGCVALFYSSVKRMVGYAGAYALGYALMAIGFVLLSVETQPWAIFAGMAAIGAGFAIVMPNFVAIALALAPARHRGIAAGILTTSVFLGQFFSPFISIPLISALDYEGTFRCAALLLSTMALAAAAAGGRSAIMRWS